ncbi:MAG: hypothetical protein CMM56_01185 [Rhodospirillaceae bacterium]|nr:hypothetical protein [Rhodospirillaceae bacterium]|tara:strand:- start:25824 stop:26237 length:414 start_codon:yes stop_codon:yes gene_type:complete
MNTFKPAIHLILSAAINLVLNLSAQAHHGDAGRYEDSIIEVSGTVVTLQFMNPHSRLILDVADEQGHIIRWQAEFGNPNRMNSEFGWTRETLKPGDRITLLGRRLKSGAPYLNLTERAQVKLAQSGQEIYRTRDFAE